MLPSDMFGSRSPQLSLPPRFFSANSAPCALKSALKRTTQRCTSPTAQLLPSFSTPGKHRTHTTAHDSLPLDALLRALPDAPSEILLATHALINPLETILTKSPVNADSKQLTQTLSPLNATFTKNRGGVPHLTPALPTAHHAPLTTHSPHQSATLCLRGSS